MRRWIDDIFGAPSSYGPVLGFDPDPDRTQEVIRQDAAGAHDHRVVIHLQLLPGLLHQDFVRSNLADLGIEEHFELPLGARYIDALTVLLFGALEGFTAVRKYHCGIAQFGN